MAMPPASTFSIYPRCRLSADSWRLSCRARNSPVKLFLKPKQKACRLGQSCCLPIGSICIISVSEFCIICHHSSPITLYPFPAKGYREWRQAWWEWWLIRGRHANKYYMSYNQCVILIDTQSIIETFLTIYYSKRPLSCDSVHCLKINAPVISGICPVTVRYLLGINASFPLSFLCFIACIMSFYHFLFLVFRLRALRLPIAGPTARGWQP